MLHIVPVVSPSQTAGEQAHSHVGTNSLSTSEENGEKYKANDELGGAQTTNTTPDVPEEDLSAESAWDLASAGADEASLARSRDD
jgi:hypothetical protein